MSGFKTARSTAERLVFGASGPPLLYFRFRPPATDSFQVN